MLQSATVTRIESVKPTAIPPAVAEVRTTDGETFPIFDWLTLEAARDAHKSQSLILLHLDERERHTYIRTITTVDPDASMRLCPWCGGGMWREQGAAVPFFGCVGCHRMIYLARVPAVAKGKPTIARARLDTTTDGVFSLDWMHHTATLMDTCRSTASWHHPNKGVHAELSPVAERSVADDSWRIGHDYKRWMGDNVTLTLADATFEVV